MVSSLMIFFVNPEWFVLCIKAPFLCYVVVGLILSLFLCGMNVPSVKRLANMPVARISHTAVQVV